MRLSASINSVCCRDINIYFSEIPLGLEVLTVIFFLSHDESKGKMNEILSWIRVGIWRLSVKKTLWNMLSLMCMWLTLIWTWIMCKNNKRLNLQTWNVWKSACDTHHSHSFSISHSVLMEVVFVFSFFGEKHFSHVFPPHEGVKKYTFSPGAKLSRTSETVFDGQVTRTNENKSCEEDNCLR